MRLCAHKLTFGLLTITAFFIVLSACAQQRTPVSATEAVAATSQPSATAVLPVLTDSASMKIGKIILLEEESYPFGLAFARQRLWVLIRQASFRPPGSILQIDPFSGQTVGEPIQVDFDPWSFAVTEDAIWVAKNGPAGCDDDQRRREPCGSRCRWRMALRCRR